MRKLIVFVLIFAILAGVFAPVEIAQARGADWEVAMNRSLDWIQSATAPNPMVGSVGGEWAVLSLARAGRVTADDPWVQGWLADVERVLSEVDAGNSPGVMRRYTDFQRLTLALGSLGIDASDFNGRDLTAVYRDFVPVNDRHASNMTINADIFALIALDSRDYFGVRREFINRILDEQTPYGAWGLRDSSVEITAMAVQALARYYRIARVRAAVDLALDWLHTQEFNDAESTAQMIVALTALGRADEASYYVQHLLRWFDAESGGFRRPTLTGSVNLMATEQAAYALVAYWRVTNGKASLYDMRDMR